MSYVVTLITLFLVDPGNWNAPSQSKDLSAPVYAVWKNGPPKDKDYFPIAVWLQSPKNAARFKKAGINLYVGLWRGPTEEQLATLKAAGMQVICSLNKVGRANLDNPTIVGWMHNDEPDNAQQVRDPKTGRQSWGPPVPPRKVVEDYEELKSTDPTRPVFLNLGQGVANDAWVGRGPNASRDDYPIYVQGADIVSFDVYPVAGIDRPDGQEYLWYVAKGVDRLVQWTGGKKVIWNCIECTHIGDPKAKATPHQVRAEVWMALIHGSTGIIYFVHQFKPAFNEHALLDDPEMLAAVTAINRQIRELAPILNSPTIAGGVTVKSGSEKVPIAAMLKRHNGATYLFAVGMRNQPARASFEVKGLPENATARLIGEDRTIRVQGGRFEDDFGPYDVRLYKMGG